MESAEDVVKMAEEVVEEPLTIQQELKLCRLQKGIAIALDMSKDDIRWRVIVSILCILLGNPKTTYRLSKRDGQCVQDVLVKLKMVTGCCFIWEEDSGFAFVM